MRTNAEIYAEIEDLANGPSNDDEIAGLHLIIDELLSERDEAIEQSRQRHPSSGTSKRYRVIYAWMPSGSFTEFTAENDAEAIAYALSRGSVLSLTEHGRVVWP